MKTPAQTDLFGTADKAGPEPKSSLEVHTHAWLRGGHYQRDGKWHSEVVHSHEGGGTPHEHPGTGPGSYVIDKDEWFRATGLRGGGRKSFTPKPSGEQLAYVPRTVEQQTFEVIVCEPPPAHLRGADNEFNGGAGPGVALPLRMIMGQKMTATVRKG